MPKWIRTLTRVFHLLNSVLLSVFLGSLIVITWLGFVGFRKTEPEVISFLRDAHSAVNTTSENLNRDCSQGKERCGTLADVNQTLHSLRYVFGQSLVALNNFNEHEDQFYGQEQALFNHADNLLSKLDGKGGTVDLLNSTIKDVNPLLDSYTKSGNQLNIELGELHKTNYTLNQYITDQPFKDFLNHSYGVANNLDSISGDISTKTHEFLFPPPCKGKLCWAKHTYNFLRDIGPLVRPFYYGTLTYESLSNGRAY